MFSISLFFCDMGISVYFLKHYCSRFLNSDCKGPTYAPRNLAREKEINNYTLGMFSVSELICFTSEQVFKVLWKVKVEIS